MNDGLAEFSVSVSVQVLDKNAGFGFDFKTVTALNIFIIKM